MDTLEWTKIGGALCGSLLFFLMLNWGTEILYHSGDDHYGEEKLAYYLEIEVTDDEKEEGTEEVIDFATLLASADIEKGKKKIFFDLLIFWSAFMEIFDIFETIYHLKKGTLWIWVENFLNHKKNIHKVYDIVYEINAGDIFKKKIKFKNKSDLNELMSKVDYEKFAKENPN